MGSAAAVMLWVRSFGTHCHIYVLARAVLYLRREEERERGRPGRSATARVKRRKREKDVNESESALLHGYSTWGGGRALYRLDEEDCRKRRIDTTNTTVTHREYTRAAEEMRSIRCTHARELCTLCVSHRYIYIYVYLYSLL